MVYSGVELSKADIEANKVVRVRADHGDREAFLTKVLEKDVSLQLPAAPVKDNTLLILIVIVLIIILLFLLKRKRPSSESG